MPTPESAAAFQSLADARTKLNDVTRELNDAHAQMHSSTEARQRHLDLQKQWQEAFSEFEKATEQFAATVKKLHQEIANQLPEPETRKSATTNIKSSADANLP